jgi:glyoxylase-like metal-dependent hydrolase (beta-lactamase superfamily II)
MFTVPSIAAGLFMIGEVFFAALTPVLNAQTGRGESKAKAAQWPSQEPVTVQKVKGEIYQVSGGSGANTGFFIGEKEVVAIDAKMTEESAKDMITEIRKLTSNPIRFVLLTHSDRDHVNGLTGFPQGVTILSHENTRKDMDAAFKEENLRAYLPDVTSPDRAMVYCGSVKINLFFFGPAHTSGDVVVFFPEEKVAFVGDLLTVGRDPLIHLAKNGTSFGLVKVLKSILELDADTFVSGHSGIAGRAEIEAEIRSVEEKQAKVKALVGQGKTLDEVKKACGVEEGQLQPGQFRFMSLPEVIDRELTEKQ